ncbi:MAG: ferritin family protein [Thermodesulfobacteriota bacterium]
MSNKIAKELQKTIKSEAEGYSFYLAAAEFVKDENGKKLFRQLAKDELGHLKALKSLSIALEKEGKWLEYEKAVDLSISMNEDEKLSLFPEKDLIPQLLGADATDFDALSFAIKIEEEAQAYYSDVFERSSSKEERSFFAALRNIEKTHVKLLKWELHSVTMGGLWLDFQEFSEEEE